MMYEYAYRVVADDEIEESVPFLLSWGRDTGPLADSIDRVGQTTPLVLWPKDGRLLLLCGIQRRAAMRLLGLTEYGCLILPDGVGGGDALRFAIEDNQRTYNDAEKVLAIGYLADHFETREIMAQYLPLLGLPPKTDFLDRFLRLNKLGEKGLDALADGRLDPESGERVLDFTSKDGEAVIGLLDALRPGKNKRREILTWLDEITRREETTVREVLARPEITETLEDEKLQRPQKETRVRAMLRAARYPEWTRMQSERDELVKSLKMPRNIKLDADPAFEGLGMNLVVRIGDDVDFPETADHLGRIFNHPALKKLVDLG